jgi:hypothetical protein
VLDLPNPIEQRAGDRETSPGAGGPGVICHSCQFDLRSLPIVARYCPRCGRDVQTKESAPMEGTASQGSFATSRVIEERFSPPQIRSPILRGFAAALYRLGRRYESGLGAGNNPVEAQRCYGKAAKLGNLAAQRRLRDPDAVETPETH